MGKQKKSNSALSNSSENLTNKQNTVKSYNKDYKYHNYFKIIAFTLILLLFSTNSVCGFYFFFELFFDGMKNLGGEAFFSGSIAIGLFMLYILALIGGVILAFIVNMITNFVSVEPSSIQFRTFCIDCILLGHFFMFAFGAIYNFNENFLFNNVTKPIYEYSKTLL